MPMTTKEFLMLEEQLKEERLLVKKYAYYARLASDPQLRHRFESNCAVHQRYCDQLLTRLHV
ncbi:MAG: spore coat protein [Anaerotruncus sp.]|nr:spore coat protein [Anaerotruncus sp.]